MEIRRMILWPTVDNLWLDTETRSAVKINRGTFKYATDAQVTVLAWAYDDDDVVVEDLHRGEEASIGFQQAIRECKTVTSHGAEFDSGVLSMHRWYRNLNIPYSRWRCSQALARMHSLPGGLDKLCGIFKLPYDLAKDEAGRELILLFCIPNADGSYCEPEAYPAKWQQFLDYAGQDVVSMREVAKRIPRWNCTEQETRIFLLDAEMNRRGVGFDIDFARAAIPAVKRVTDEMKGVTVALTDGAVESTTQRDKLLKYILAAYGVDLPNLKADTIERRLDDPELPDDVKELLRMRLSSTKASTAKFRRVLQSEIGGRLYGLLLYFGARPGRWAGRIFQPHNLPRPKHKQWQIDLFIDAVKNGDAELLFEAAEIPDIAASSLRGLIVAAEGRKLNVADLANIEGRVLPWMAGEEWKLQAFRDYDAKIGPDLYKVAYARSFNMSPDDVGDESPERQIGKVQELALGFYGGVGAFVNMAAAYRVDLAEMADRAYDTLPASIIADAKKRWFKAVEDRRTYDLPERIWIVCMSFVLLWRNAHPATRKFWYAVQEAAADAINTPDRVFVAGCLKFDRRGNWLRMHLPSGRYICYPGPRVDEDGISYLGWNHYRRCMGRIRTYSGKLVQNADEAISRDILAAGLLDADADGYNPVLSVHDEAICDSPDEDRFSAKGLCEHLTRARSWTDGLPLAAKGFQDTRYGKK
jgi:DNA polymerase bacteriophage-type